MYKKKALFIINPISGGKNKDKLPSLINSILDKSKYDFEITFTERPGHASELSSQPNYDCFISVGGDGTINEVARNLVHSKAALGILPMGSGNGLSRHVGIEMNIEKAIAQLNNAKEILVDACSINGNVFLNMAGVGFDAHIGKVFAESKKRGFKTYVLKTFTEYNAYKPQRYKIKYEGKQVETDAFLISFANSSQYGNNVYIAPNADVKDGKLEICILKPFHVFNLPEIGYRLFNKTINECKLLQTISTNELTLERESEGVAHLDGEPFLFGKKLEIKVIPASLKLLVPQT